MPHTCSHESMASICGLLFRDGSDRNVPGSRHPCFLSPKAEDFAELIEIYSCQPQNAI